MLYLPFPWMTLPVSDMFSVVYLHAQSCGTQHIPGLFSLTNLHGDQSLSLPRSISALSSGATSPGCFLCESQSKSSLLQSRFSIQSPRPIPPRLFCALCVRPFLRPSLRSSTPPPHTPRPSLLSVSCRLLCKASSIPMEGPPTLPVLPHRPGVIY